MPKIPDEVGKGSRARVLQFLLANLTKVVSSDEIRKAAGSSEWARRLRELRDEFGYQILSHNDRRQLKPGQYLLETDVRNPVLPRTISKETRAFILERNGYTCQMCGLAASDPDPLHPGQKIRLTMGHIIDKSKGGTDRPENLRAVCTNCNEGLQNIAPPKPGRIELLKQVRRATIEDQLHLLDWLAKKYGKIKPPETK
jgi:hypothetical protein